MEASYSLPRFQRRFRHAGVSSGALHPLASFGMDGRLPNHPTFSLSVRTGEPLYFMLSAPLGMDGRTSNPHLAKNYPVIQSTFRKPNFKTSFPFCVSLTGLPRLSSHLRWMGHTTQASPIPNNGKKTHSHTSVAMLGWMGTVCTCLAWLSPKPDKSFFFQYCFWIA